MNLKKPTISTAIAIALGCCSFTATAALGTSATLDFSLGSAQTVACNYGTTPPCNSPGYATTDIVGSYFSMDTNDDGTHAAYEKNPIGSFNGIHIGTTQLASGSHSGGINGTESPNIDEPWQFFGNTGMHQTTAPITLLFGTGDQWLLDMSGWSVTWNGIPNIPMVDQGSSFIECTTGSSCSNSSSYTLDAAFHVAGAGFTTVSYALHLEGHVSNVPVPAAAWLFGSGLLGLIGVARRKKAA
jgi:hypothetical protein